MSLEVCGRRRSTLAPLLPRPPILPLPFAVPKAQVLVLRENCPPRRTVKAGSCQVALFENLLASYVVPGLQHA